MELGKVFFEISEDGREQVLLRQPKAADKKLRYLSGIAAGKTSLRSPGTSQHVTGITDKCKMCIRDRRKESSFGRCIWRAENNGRRAGIRVAMRDTGPFSDPILTFLLKYNSVVSIKGKRRGR